MKCITIDNRIFPKEVTLLLKAILPILIIFHHLSFKCEGGFWEYFAGIGKYIVALFLFISGYGLMYGYLHRMDYLKTHRFIIHRLLPVVLPFLFSICIYHLFSTIGFYHIPNKGDVFLHIIGSVILSGDTNIILPASWYVFNIFIVYVLFFLIFKGRYLLKYKVITMSLCVLILMVAYRSLGYGGYWYVSMTALLSGLLMPLYNMQNWGGRILMLIFLILSCLLQNVIGIVIFNALFPILFIPIVTFLNMGKISENKLVIFLASISYEMYLTHVIAYRLLRGTFINISSDILYIISTLIVTFALSIIVKNLSVLLLNKLKNINICR